ncbi:unnamed protein product, partial [Timema podura]|nr:unnamed protein product [Timema podura]
DETDTSNSVHEIVKTEIKLNDSSLGIMDSNIDHFAPVDKSEEVFVLNIEKKGNVKLQIVLRWFKQEDIVLHMVGERNVKLRIVPRNLRKEDIVLHMEGKGNVKLKIVLRWFRQEDIVLHMEGV